MNQEKNETSSPKKIVSEFEFKKFVERQLCQCQWIEHMSPAQARTEAHKRVSRKYEIGEVPVSTKTNVFPKW